MSEQEAKTEGMSAELAEKVLLGGDLSKLSPRQKVEYYLQVCSSLGLNPLTRPFEFIVLSGKLVMYARRDAAEQLRKLNGVSITRLTHELVGDIYLVTAAAEDKYGRVDESTGAVNVANLKGEMLANAMMKAETKAKRRVTLSISGLGLPDENELDGIVTTQQLANTQARRLQLSAPGMHSRLRQRYQEIVAEARRLGKEVAELPEEATTEEIMAEGVALKNWITEHNQEHKQDNANEDEEKVSDEKGDNDGTD